jgi:sulfatase maturation enzyme AslB (radical SAM superfamily)
VYCYNSRERAEKGEHSLNYEKAKAALDEYFKENCGIFNIVLKEPAQRHIRFYGPGEATEEEGFLLLQQITEYAQRLAVSKGYNLITELQTNGAFNGEVRKWILDNINLLWVSFDGTPIIHNKQRPMLDYIDINGDDVTKDSSPIIIENIKWINANQLQSKNNIMVGLRSTITKDSIDHQKDIIDFFEELGVKYSWSDPEFPAVDEKPVCETPPKYERYDYDLNSYVENYIDAYRYAKSKGIFFGSFLGCNFDNAQNGTSINCRCCIPVPHITPDGCVSACDLVVLGNHPNHMDCFVYGKWNNKQNKFELDEAKIKALQGRNIENGLALSHCASGYNGKECPALRHCAGYCPGEVVNETGYLSGRLDSGKRKVCQAINKLYHNLYEEITEDLKSSTEYLVKGSETGFYPFPHP